VFLLALVLVVLDPVLRALLDHGAGGDPAVDGVGASLRVEVLALVRVAQVALQSVQLQTVWGSVLQNFFCCQWGSEESLFVFLEGLGSWHHISASEAGVGIKINPITVCCFAFW